MGESINDPAKEEQEETKFEPNSTTTTTTTTTTSNATTSRKRVALITAASQDKVKQVLASLQPWLQPQPREDKGEENDSGEGSLLLWQELPCRTAAEAVAYRCRCGFQILRRRRHNQPEQDKNDPQEPDDDTNDSYDYYYAVRRENQLVPVQLDSFLIANRRIQRAMGELLRALNNDNDDKYRSLTSNLTNVSFASSWYDEGEVDKCKGSNDDGDGDRGCLLMTLHYNAPIDQREAEWKQAAAELGQALQLQQLSGRSRKCLLRAFANDDKNNTRHYIRDTIYISKHKNHNNNKDDETSHKWHVSLRKEANPSSSSSSLTNSITVHYEKPEDAFCHPNATVMCRALEWMLSRLDAIILLENNNNTSRRRHVEGSSKLRLLELYCGCGAHTVPLAKVAMATATGGSLVLESITAIEWDERLTTACRRNCQLNDIPVLTRTPATTTTTGAAGGSENKESGASILEGTAPATTGAVEIISQDAGKWARRMCRNLQTANRSPLAASQQEQECKFDILLVDPPKQGLDPAVCDFVLNHLVNIPHILYISCGRDALVRDLQRLQGQYQVVHCVVMDLFPQTHSVETLVHLQRIPTTNTTT